MLAALHEIYVAAGPPGLRQISIGLKDDDSIPATLNYQAVGKILNGKQLPSPRQLMSLTLWLHKEGNVDSKNEGDYKELVTQLMRFREAAHRDQLGIESTEVPLASAEAEGRNQDLRNVSSAAKVENANERKVLSCMLQSKDAIADVVEILRASDFSSDLHKEIYNVLLELYAEGREVSIEETANKLNSLSGFNTDSERYVSTLLLEVADPSEASHHAEIISDSALGTRIGALGRKVAEMADGMETRSDLNAQSLLNALEGELFSMVRERSAPIGDSLEETLDEVEAAGGSIIGVPSGFREFDALNSGFRPGELVIVAGASGMGKSTLGLDFIRRCSVGHARSSFLVSLQMSRVEINMRILSAEARVAIHHMRSGTMRDEDWTRLARVMPSVAAAPIYMTEEPGYTIAQLRASCSRLGAFHDLKLVVIDSLDLLYLDESESAGDHDRSLAITVRELRKMAKELNLPVTALYPVRRISTGYRGRQPELHDIPDCLENFADVVILLHREDAYERASPRAGEADFIVAKNRNGPTFVTTTAFQGHYARFVDLDET
ncbi:DnaB-like helicase C-terminal domain-containing protein [Streptomyces cyaneofuscatus]|uniref:replicative DNA helicase n=1 Tax=Streptomyces cyaneofuscatus TaxID=66883 RepID=UPI00343FE9BD